MIRDDEASEAAGRSVSVSPSPEGPVDDIDTDIEALPVVSGSSPVPAELKPVDLDFGQAMLRVVDGHRVRRRSWGGKETVFLRAGVAHIQNDSGTFTLTVQDADITAADWLVLEN